MGKGLYYAICTLKTVIKSLHTLDERHVGDVAIRVKTDISALFTTVAEEAQEEETLSFAAKQQYTIWDNTIQSVYCIEVLTKVCDLEHTSHLFTP